MTTEKKTSNRWFIALWIIVILLFIAYTAYWFIARGLINQGVDDWLTEEKARGAVVEYADKKIIGYPFRFALKVTDPVYQTTERVRWEGEELQLIMQPWKWNHIIARVPGRNMVTDPNGFRHTAFLGDKSAGSISWTDDAIKRIGLSLDDAELLILGEDIKAKNFSFNLAPAKGAPDDLRIAVQWESLIVPDANSELAFLGTDIAPSRMIAKVEDFFPALNAAGGDFNQLPRTLVSEEADIELAQLLLNWGPLKFGSKADLSADGGAWNGTVSFRIDDPDPLAAAMTNAGYDPDVQNYVRMIGAASKDGKFLDLSVSDNTILVLGQTLGTIPTQ